MKHGAHMDNIALRKIRVFILILTVLQIQACAGYIEYGKDFSTVDQFEVLYTDTRKSPYDKNTKYFDANISKQEVLDSWGSPYSIEIQGGREFGTREVWKYHRGIAMRGIAPIIIIPVPLPLIWWPEGWDTTTVRFKDDIVIAAESRSRSFNDGYVCLVVFCTDYPIRLH